MVEMLTFFSGDRTGEKIERALVTVLTSRILRQFTISIVSLCCKSIS